MPLIVPSPRQLSLVDINCISRPYTQKGKGARTDPLNPLFQGSTIPNVNLAEIKFARMGNTNSAFGSLEGW